MESHSIQDSLYLPNEQWMGGTRTQATKSQRRKRNIEADEAILRNEEVHFFTVSMLRKHGRCEHSVGNENQGPGSLRPLSLAWRFYCVAELKVGEALSNRLCELPLPFCIPLSYLTH